MASNFWSAHGLTASELMQAALHEHDREIQDLKLAHNVELEVLHRNLEKLRRDKALLEEQMRKSVVLAAAPGDMWISASESCSPEPADGVQAQTRDEVPMSTPADEESVASEKSVRRAGTASSRRSSHNSNELHLFMSQENHNRRHSSIRRFVDGRLEDIVQGAIVLNSIFIFVQLQCLGYESAAKAGLLSVSAPDEGLQTALDGLEHMFNIFFLLEVCFRMAVLRRYFAVNEFTKRVEVTNILDFVIVALTSIDLYLTPKGLGGGSMNLTVFRMLRFLRLAKVARVGMALQVFYKLRVLLATFACSMMALFWSIVMIFGCLLIIALFANQLVIMSLQDESISVERREWMFLMYGTSTRACWTLFELTFSGGWPAYARPLLEEVSPLWAIFFAFHIVTVQFAMFRIVTSLFLRDALALAASDAELAVQDKLHTQKEISAKLLAFFKEADTSSDGFLSPEEFCLMLESPKVRAWLSLLDLDVCDAMQAFDLMQVSSSKGNGMICADEFVEGMMRMKGQARSQDVLAIWHMEQRLVKDIALLSRGFHALQRRLEDTSEIEL